MCSCINYFAPCLGWHLNCVRLICFSLASCIICIEWEHCSAHKSICNNALYSRDVKYKCVSLTVQIYTELDLWGSYNLVQINHGDEWKTTFGTRYGHCERSVMPFGLCNEPAGFQRFMNVIFQDMLDQFVVIYLDVIFMCLDMPKQQNIHVRLVLQWLWEYHLYAKLENCTFYLTKVVSGTHDLSLRILNGSCQGPNVVGPENHVDLKRHPMFSVVCQLLL